MTANEIPRLDYDHGVYINYYVGNEVVVFPTFDDPNDKVAAEIVASLYPDRSVWKINFTELYRDGGLAHCVTQQQPVRRDGKSSADNTSLSDVDCSDTNDVSVSSPASRVLDKTAALGIGSIGFVGLML